MSMVLRIDGGPGKGRQILQEAVDIFRLKLTDDERHLFDEQRVLDPRPDANSVMIFIVKVDSKNERKLSRRVASKLHSFLDAVQQFTGIVDTFASSTPPIAQLVWASVKATISIVSSFGEYFEKLAALFYSIGENCPRLQEFGSLYESSAGLQNTLCLYFAEIIRICGKALEVSRQPGIVLFFRATFKPFEREFSDAQGNLIKYANRIKEEANLASSRVQVQEEQLNKLERRKNESFRDLIAPLISASGKDIADVRQQYFQSEKRRVERLRRQIRKNLCSLNPATAWDQARKQCLATTAEWYQQNTAFLDWVAHSSSAPLACLANLGSGKTIVSSNVIAYLKLQNPTTSKVAYFFCQSETTASLRARDILGGLASQLLEPIICSIEGAELEDFMELSLSPRPDDILSLIAAHRQANFTSFIVIDGLDECDGVAVESVLRGLRDLLDYSQSDHHYKIFVSCRPDLVQKVEFILGSCFRLTPSAAQLNHDLDSYIEATLRKKWERGELSLNDPQFIETIQDVLLAGVHGMFLWACLLIEDLCLYNNDNDILAALQHIPTKLSELFDRLLVRTMVDKVNCDTSGKLLKWTISARRVLTMDELREAVTIELGQSVLSTTVLPTDLYRSVSKCCGLLCVDEDDLTVRLVHPSLKQHILSASDDGGSQSLRLDLILLEKELASLCITYLRFNEFKQALVKISTPTPAVKPAEFARNIVGQSRHQHPTAEKTIALLRNHLGRPSETQTTKILIRAKKSLADIAHGARKVGPVNGRLMFIDYARSQWIHHAGYLVENENRLVWRQFCQLVTSTDSHVERPWENCDSAKKISDSLLSLSTPESSTCNMQAIVWAIEHDNLALVDFQLSLISVRDNPSTEANAHAQAKTASRLKGRSGLRKINAQPAEQMVGPPVAVEVTPGLSSHFGLTQLILQDLSQLLPSENLAFALSLCTRIQYLLKHQGLPQSVRAFIHALLAIFYGAAIEDDSVSGIDIRPQGNDWSFAWLATCGWSVPDPVDQDRPLRSDLARLHGVGTLEHNTEFSHPASLLVGLAVALDKAAILKLLVNAFRVSAPWALFAAIEAAVAYHRNDMAAELWENSAHAVKRGGRANELEDILGGTNEIRSSRLAALALQHGATVFAYSVAAMEANPDAEVDGNRNSLLMYACEYGDIDVFAQLLAKSKATPVESGLGIKSRDYLQGRIAEIDRKSQGMESVSACTRSADVLSQMLQMSPEEARIHVGSRNLFQPSIWWVICLILILPGVLFNLASFMSSPIFWMFAAGIVFYLMQGLNKTGSMMV